MTPAEVPDELVEAAVKERYDFARESGGTEWADLPPASRAYVMRRHGAYMRRALAAVLPLAIAMGHDEAASIVHSEARFQTELSMRRSLCAEYTAQRMSVLEETIRGFASRLRAEEVKPITD